MTKYDYVKELIDLGYDVLLFPIEEPTFRTFFKLAEKKNEKPEMIIYRFVKKYVEKNNRS